eukprot:6833263-Prymnesium_polylepis.1
MRIVTATARAQKTNPLAELKGLASVCSRVGTDAWHNGDKLSVLKLSAPFANLEGEHERLIPAQSLTNEALDERRDF